MQKISNPFTPAFGGKPQFFFGRQAEVSSMRRALQDPNSPFRAVFVTGNRGCGKTALIEHISSMARKLQWSAIDVHSSHASQTIVKSLARASQQTEEKSFSPTGLGVSLGSVGVSATRTYDELDLTALLLERSQRMTDGRGVFISIDEVQKISEEDMENVCAAFQMSLRKGIPVMLVLAGLPGAKEKVANYEGCTFMQRAQEIELGSLLIDETHEAYASMLAHVDHAEYREDTIAALARRSLGHPYLMQLLGYYLVEQASTSNASDSLKLEATKVEAAFAPSYLAYRANVLEPSLARLGGRALAYLTAVATLLDENRVARTASVAEAMNMSEQQASTYRQRLIKRRLIAPAGWGYVTFCLPYLAQFLTERREQKVPSSKQWLN